MHLFVKNYFIILLDFFDFEFPKVFSLELSTHCLLQVLEVTLTDLFRRLFSLNHQFLIQQALLPNLSLNLWPWTRTCH